STDPEVWTIRIVGRSPSSPPPLSAVASSSKIEQPVASSPAPAVPLPRTALLLGDAPAPRSRFVVTGRFEATAITFQIQASSPTVCNRFLSPASPILQPMSTGSGGDS